MDIFKKRIQNAQERLNQDEIDAIIITNNSNIFYLSGLTEFPSEERDARIVITKKSAYILTDFRYTEAVLHKAPHLELIEISYNNSLVQAITSILSSQPQIIGIESNSLTVNELSTLTSNFSNKTFKPIGKFIEELRMKKDQEEITAIQKACHLTDQVFDFIVRHVKSGVTEKELAWEIEKYIKEHNGTLSFPSIVAFGEHSAIPHHSPTDKKLSTSENIVLFDMGSKVDSYCSDMTRTFFINSPSSKTEKAYTTLLGIQKNAIDDIGNYKDQHFATQNVAINVNNTLVKNGYSEVPHGLGHGVGIDVHESPILSPFSDNPLYEGMVLTIEPGIYIPGKFGIRIEDTIALDNNALQLTNSPKEIMVHHLTD